MARRSLIWLLNRTSERRCHDPRDKFFALYGMVPGIQKVFPVDYEKSESDVELEVTAFILNHCIGGAVIFATFSLQTHPFLPSWVPSYRNSTVVYNPGQIFGSSGRLAPCLQQLNGAAPAQVGDLVKGWSEDMSRVTLSIFARNWEQFGIFSLQKHQRRGPVADSIHPTHRPLRRCQLTTSAEC